MVRVVNITAHNDGYCTASTRAPSDIDIASSSDFEYSNLEESGYVPHHYGESLTYMELDNYMEDSGLYGVNTNTGLSHDPTIFYSGNLDLFVRNPDILSSGPLADFPISVSPPNFTESHQTAAQATLVTEVSAGSPNLLGSTPPTPLSGGHLRGSIAPLPITRAKKSHCCEDCAEVFQTTRMLRQHKRATHGGEVFLCDYKGCSQSFARAGDLRRHKEDQHTSNPLFFRCRCGYASTRRRKDNYLRHLGTCVSTHDKPTYLCGCGYEEQEKTSHVLHIKRATCGILMKRGRKKIH